MIGNALKHRLAYVLILEASPKKQFNGVGSSKTVPHAKQLVECSLVEPIALEAPPFVGIKGIQESKHEPHHRAFGTTFVSPHILNVPALMLKEWLCDRPKLPKSMRTLLRCCCQAWRGLLAEEGVWKKEEELSARFLRLPPSSSKTTCFNISGGRFL